MSDLSAFPITRKWAAQHPDRIQLYSVPTPNGIKVSAMLEETGLPYEPHFVSFSDNEQKSDAFLSLNPNGKIPAIIDPDGPDGQPIGLWESGAILIYLAEKTGLFIPAERTARIKCVQWVMFQMGGIGPMFGQFGFFHMFDGSKWGDDRPRERYRSESERLLGVLEDRLKDRSFIMGNDYTIADMAMWGWVRGMRDFYEAGDDVHLGQMSNVTRWLEACLQRPASQKAIDIPSKG